MLHIADLGISSIDQDSGALSVQAAGSGVEDDSQNDLGSIIMAMALGLAARPAEPDDSGAAQGIISEVEGTSVVVGAHDPRAGAVYGEIQAGESAFFATGKGFDSRALAKKRMFTILVGDSTAIVLDARTEGEEQIVLTCPGGAIKISAKDGIVASDANGQACIQLSNGVNSLMGSVVLAGRNPTDNPAAAQSMSLELQKIAMAFATFVPGSGGASFSNPYIMPGNVKANGVSLGS